MKFPTATAVRTPLLVSALLAALITATGCSKHAADAGSVSDSTTQSGADTGTAPDAKAQAADEAAQAKYNGYVAAYNVLVDQDGLASDAKLYFSQSLDKLNADSMVYSVSTLMVRCRHCAMRVRCLPMPIRSWINRQTR